MVWQRLARLVRDEDGPTTVEYAVMLALVVVVCVVSVAVLGKAVEAAFDALATAVQST
jgi:pilus assembly protein Flp/PilA